MPDGVVAAGEQGKGRALQSLKGKSGGSLYKGRARDQAYKGEWVHVVEGGAVEDRAD
jgi:hypothetical protein